MSIIIFLEHSIYRMDHLCDTGIKIYANET